LFFITIYFSLTSHTRFDSIIIKLWTGGLWWYRPHTFLFWIPVENSVDSQTKTLPTIKR